MRMIQEIASFVNPDPTVEFDPASRVSRHASLKCASLLSFSSLPLRRPNVSLSARNFSLLFSLRVSRSLSRTLMVRRSRSLDQNKRSNWTSSEREAKGRRREKKEERISRQRGIEHSRRDKERGGGRREGGRRRRRMQQEKKEEQREEQQK